MSQSGVICLILLDVYRSQPDTTVRVLKISVAPETVITTESILSGYFGPRTGGRSDSRISAVSNNIRRRDGHSRLDFHRPNVPPPPYTPLPMSTVPESSSVTPAVSHCHDGSDAIYRFGGAAGDAQHPAKRPRRVGCKGRSPALGSQIRTKTSSSRTATSNVAMRSPETSFFPVSRSHSQRCHGQETVHFSSFTPPRDSVHV